MNYILLLLVSLVVGDSIDGDDRKGIDLREGSIRGVPSDAPKKHVKDVIFT